MMLVTVGSLASDERAPDRLSETGLYASGQPGVIARENRPFQPQYPLWTDGAAKKRWVYLPPGATIDATQPGAWDVPVGTRFWKQFEFGGHKVETRMIWRSSLTRWVFASYLWNAEGTDATLAPEEGVPGVVQVASGRWHSIPAVSDCAACHGSNRTGPLGFNSLQLSPDRDPNAIHGEPLNAGSITLGTLIDEGRLAPQRSALLAYPPRIATDNPRTRAMLGYLLANCGSCHNGRGEIAALGPTLKYDELLQDADSVARGLVRQPTRWQVPSVVEGHSVLIEPLALHESALLVRMRSRSPSSQMPPLGTVRRDGVALDRLAEWIASDLRH
jgi:mono/diheme cytochrome c family protein